MAGRRTEGDVGAPSDRHAANRPVDEGSRRRDHTVALLLCAFATPILLAVFVEWAHYRDLLGLHEVDGTTRGIVGWLLVAKTQWMLATPLLLAVVLGWTGWRRSGLAVFALLQATVAMWLLTDLRVQAHTGNHLRDYVELVGQANFTTYGGGLQQSFRDGAFLALALLVAAFTMTAACLRLARGLPPRAMVLAWFVSTLAIVPASRSLLEPLLAANVAASMPFEFVALTSTGDESALAAFAQEIAEDLKPLVTRRHAELMNVQPADRDTRFSRADAPDVVILVIESFRALAFREDVTPNMVAHSRKGLLLERHYAGSNKSHLGMFTLLYGRLPLIYNRTVWTEPPQLPLTLALSGYRTTYTSGLDHRGWLEMDSFVNEPAFERMILRLEGRECLDWPQRDRAVMDTVRESLADGSRPQFVVAFLGSTHYPYMWPPGSERFGPVAEPTLTSLVTDEDREPPTMQSIFRDDPTAGREGFLNRYYNSIGFLDDLIGDFLDTVDLTRTLVIVTGDHGESFWDDGTLAHSYRASEVQTRTPFFMIGASVPVARVHAPTTHADVLPTLLPLLAGSPIETAHTMGEDLLDPVFSRRHASLTGFDPPSRDSSVLMVADEGRLRVRFTDEFPSVEVLGSVDAIGDYAPQPPERGDAALWAGRLAHDIERFSR